MPVTYHYNKFPPKLTITNELQLLISQANRELGNYNGYLQSIANPRVFLSPLFSQEAVLSSRIEGTQSTLSEVLAYEGHRGKQKIPEEKKDDIMEVLNYRRAMRIAERLMEKLPLSEKVLRAAHKRLMQGVRGQGKSPGEYRKIPVWIGPDKTDIKKAEFIPLEAQHINSAMAKFSHYLHEEKGYDNIIKIAVLHAEFESIHPFLDGNGRVGRLLIPLYLWAKGVIVSPSFYISAYFEKNRESYYALLRRVSAKNDWLGWIEFFTKGVIQQSQENLARAKKITQFYRNLKEKIPALTKSAYGITALDFIFKTPSFYSSYFYQKSDIPRQTSIRLLNTFEEEKILECFKGKGRSPNFYFFRKLIDIAEGEDSRNLV